MSAATRGAADEGVGKAALLFETDWLASDPVYYNEVTGAASHGINDVIDFANVELDAEGLNAYLGTGSRSSSTRPCAACASCRPLHGSGEMRAVACGSRRCLLIS